MKPKFTPKFNFLFKKLLLIGLFFLLGNISNVQGQNQLWYENQTNTEIIKFASATQGTLSINVINPNTSGINTNSKVTRFVRNGNESPFVTFTLPKSITSLSNLEIRLRAYINSSTNNLTTTNSRIRLYLRNSSIGASSVIYSESNFDKGLEWKQFFFNFNDKTIPSAVLNAGGYDQIMIGFAGGDTTGLTTTYYLDRIVSTINIATFGGSPDPSILAGSWGVWYQIPGGFNLDNSPANWPVKAQEVIDDLPTMGHVILNFTQSAHGYYFLLRNNPYVDIANDIESDMVPSAAKDQVILDVIKKFKDAGKRVILYVATDGPSATSGTPDNASYRASWEAYYKNSPLFLGTNAEKEGQAWRLLCKGFFERFRDAGVDGYWLDHVGGLPGELVDYVAMIRKVDPKAILATNSTLDNGAPDFYSYFKDANGNDLYVDTDNASEQVGVNGINDDPNRDYQVKAFNATDPYMDFTGGHITPLALGAPPNSWAYEEFTIAEMVKSAYDSYDGSKKTMRHGFFPMREEWTAAASDLVFTDVEQAYRFVRRITDAGASMTFATNMVGGTTSKAATAGTMSLDEKTILKGVDSRMSQSPKPNYVPYSRPAGAYLVGEAETIFIQENQVGYCGVEGSINNNYSGYTSTGFSNTTDVLGSGINWEINGSAGAYNLVWRYANGQSVNRLSRLIINGSTVLENLSFPSTGSGSTWNTASITINLNAGVKNIRLEASNSQGLANIDYVKITGPADMIRSSCAFTTSKSISSKDNGLKDNELNENKVSISIFPNPVLDEFQIHGVEVDSVEIYSVSGQLVKTFNTSQSSYSVADLISGVYFVKISNTTGGIIHKLIKS